MVKKTSIVVLAAAAALSAASASAFTREKPPPFDAAIGHNRVSDIEAGISPRRDENGSRRDIRSPFGQPTATSIGNLITVQAGPNSTVIVNANQINRGNQIALNGSLSLD